MSKRLFWGLVTVVGLLTIAVIVFGIVRGVIAQRAADAKWDAAAVQLIGPDGGPSRRG